MPTYDYVCAACAHRFEYFQSMSDERLSKCPQCGKKRLERLIGSGAGIVFKGSGFYETDYKRRTQPAGGDSASPGETASTTPAAPGPSGGGSAPAAPKAPAAKPAEGSSAPASDPAPRPGTKGAPSRSNKGPDAH